MPVPFPFAELGGSVQEQTHTFRDAKGFTGVVRYYVVSNGASADTTITFIVSILTQLKLLTNAKYQNSSGVLSEYGVKQYGSAAAAYASIRQKARLVLQDLAGGLHAFNIPAPIQATVFAADRQTVLPSGVAALTALLTNTSAFPPASPAVFVSNRSGIQLTNFMGGFFVARQTKKNKLFYLDANLDPSEPGD